MKTKTSLLITIAALACSAPALLAQTAGPGAAGSNRPTTPPAMEGPGSAHSEAMRTRLREFAAQREEFIAQRRELVARLQTATEEERQAIIAELRLQLQSRVEEQRALAKQIREEMKALREQRRQQGPNG